MGDEMPKETIKGVPSGGPHIELDVNWGKIHDGTIQVATRNTEVEDRYSAESGWAIHLNETQSSALIRALTRAHRRTFLSIEDD
jgi:hypothetical protein